MKYFSFFFFIIFFSYSIQASELSVVTWNLGDSDRKLPEPKQVFEVFKNRKIPDILIIQEAFPQRFSEIKNIFGYKYHIHSSDYSDDIKNLGILSKYKLTKPDILVLSKNNSGALKAEIELKDNKNFKIYCVHFDFIKSKKRNKNGYVKLNFKESFQILKNEIFSPNTRKNEANSLLSWSGKDAKRTILAGDFNTIAMSSGIRTIKKYYKDSIPFYKFIFSRGTYKKINFPLLPRIDYIFLSKDLSADKYEVIKQTPGDHFPVFVTIKNKPALMH